MHAPADRQVDDRRQLGCPKHMVYGPCGGVRADLSCELAEVPCPFATRTAAVGYQGETHPGSGALRVGPAPHSAVLAESEIRPVVLTDLTVRPYDADQLRQVVGMLAGSCDAVLVGEHQNRPDFAPVLLAELIADAGGRGWITLSCRDRNRLVLEQELAALSHLRVDAVLCVTGDGRAPGIRPGVTQVFDLDGTRLTALAVEAGLTAAVPESPHAPPVALRPDRLLQKQRAGAGVCILNHVTSAAQVRAFVDRARAVGVTVPFIASVAVYTDQRSAAVLQRFPGLALDTGQVTAVLDAKDPVRAGIAAAAAEARELLAIDGVVGVNVSGLASGRGEVHGAEVKAAVGYAIRELWP